ncbi:unnamed protein product [Pieris macdunnoughi]|uniref:Uncharacterized protein n=1 Tax=Pieris macdunnoughi TaxID=345717 RepID=A0A821XQG8_9NEOP|nr:unnamed protein product [Pieris macdunnoughi]
MEDKYHTKLSNALLNSIQMLPMCAEIINNLKEARSPGQVSGILKELGDILLLTTARSTQKIYFPLLLAYKMWTAKPEGLSWSFSGTAMMKFYNVIIQEGCKFQIKTGADPLKTSEVVFHALFGTYLEDLSVLAQITTHAKWHQRKDLNSVFHQRASKTSATVIPIKFKYVSKMAQSLLTKSLGNVDPVATSRPSFSGFRKRTLTQEFLSYLQTGKATHSFSGDPMLLQFALKKTKDSLLEEKDSVKMTVAGTKTWRENRMQTVTWLVTKKINSFRTAFKKEEHKVAESLKSGAAVDEIYKPKLWYYDQLSFLKDQCISRSSRSSMSDHVEYEVNT